MSHLSHHKYYESILYFLSQKKYAITQEITKGIRGSPKSGGSLTDILKELEDCGFIERYTPLTKQQESKLVRYALSDAYLQWYYTFIYPKRKSIEAGKFIKNPLLTLNRRAFETIMGLNFERWCRKNSPLFAKIMEFSGVDYEAGAFFNKKTEQQKGFQIDLMYIIKGSKIIICEIKYSEGKVTSSVYEKVREKLELFRQVQPQYKNYTFETVLITSEGLKTHESQLTFDRVITFNEIFNPRYWE